MSSLPAPDDKRWLIKTVLLRKRRTMPAAVLMSLGFVTNGLTPVLVGRAIDDAIARGSLGHLGLWLMALAASFLINGLANWWARNLFSLAMLEVGHVLRMAVTDRIQDPRGMAGPRRTAGELLAIASTDAQRVGDAVFMTVFPVAEVTSIIYVATMVSVVNLPLGLAVLVGGPIVVLISLRAAKPLRHRSGARQAALAKAAATATDVVQGLRILKGLGAIDTVRSRYAAVSDAAYTKTVAANGARAKLNATTETVGAVYVVLVALAAGSLALKGSITIGELISVVGLTQFIITPMTMLGKNIASRWANAQASGKRIRAVLGAGFAEHPEVELPALPRGVTVVDAPAPEGLEYLPHETAVVAPHQSDLFEGSVLSNVHEDPEKAREALWVAAADDIPGGPEREVGENGGNLSGGQRQRVALARAIAADAPILILQDPTTAVDSVTEAIIAERVAAHRAGQTTVIYTSAPAWQAVAVDVTADVQEAEA